eukprot:g43300.t1
MTFQVPQSRGSRPVTKNISDAQSYFLSSEAGTASGHSCVQIPAGTSGKKKHDSEGSPRQSVAPCRSLHDSHSDSEAQHRAAGARPGLSQDLVAASELDLTTLPRRRVTQASLSGVTDSS